MKISTFPKGVQRILLLTFLSFIISIPIYGQFTCGSATTLAVGGCRTGDSFGGNTGAALCSGQGYGGNGSLRYYTFTTPANGDCIQFDFTSNTIAGNMEFTMWTSGCASYMPGSGNCWRGINAGGIFSYSSRAGDGTQVLTAGTTYTIRVWSKNGGNYDLCLNRQGNYQADDECTGASTLTSTPTAYYNGGDCDYSGPVDNPSALDLPANFYCAGSLENTRFFTYTAASNGDILLSGSNINCIGGACGYQFGAWTTGVGGNCSSSFSMLGCASEGPGCGSGPDPSTTLTISRITWTNVQDTDFEGLITGVTAGEVFYFGIDGNADADCEFTLAVVEQILPVESLHFVAEARGDKVDLMWTVSSEEEVDRYQILRSTDGNTYAVIGSVKAQGEIGQTLNYSHFDQEPVAGLNMYKIEEIGTNGISTFSEEASVLFNAEYTMVQVNVGQVAVNVETQFRPHTDVTLSLMQVDGREVAARRVVLGGAVNQFDLLAENMKTGIYILQLSGQGKSYIRKLYHP